MHIYSHKMICSGSGLLSKKKIKRLTMFMLVLKSKAFNVMGCYGKVRVNLPSNKHVQGVMWNCPKAILAFQAKAIYAWAVQRCRKQEDAVLLSHSKATLHTIAAKSLPNWIIQSWLWRAGYLSFSLCATIKSVWKPAE